MSFALQTNTMVLPPPLPRFPARHRGYFLGYRTVEVGFRRRIS
jgi:hypothetical protein